MHKHIKLVFEDKFADEPMKTYFSPGRVNIIGEHIDYNGGSVMPFCIDKGIYAAIRKNDKQMIRVLSENFPLQSIQAIAIDIANFEKRGNYSDYVQGIILEIRKLGFKLEYGLDIALSSNLVVGGGLSSSAALAVLLIKIFNDEYRLDFDRKTIALLAKKIENVYLGVNCGIMDQFAIAYGKKDKAIFLNTKDLSYQYLPLNLTDFHLVLINSNVTRKLAESKYNQRQAETQEILRLVNEKSKVDALCDIFDIDEFKDIIFDDVLWRRFRHVVSENIRVMEAKAALEANNFYRLGVLLNESHKSLRDDYEVSTTVLDELVDIAIESGALGARMIGGGFGGSTLNLVLKKDFEGFVARFKELNQKKSNNDFIYSIVQAKDGVMQID